MSSSNPTLALQGDLSFSDEDMDNLLVLSEKKYQLQPANDINQKINLLSKEIAQFAGAFSLSREIVNQSIDDLKQQSTDTQSQLEQLQTQYDQEIHVVQQGVVVLSNRQIKTDQSLAALKSDADEQRQQVQQALAQHDDCFTEVQAGLARCDEEFIQPQAAMATQDQRNSELTQSIQSNKLLIEGLQALHTQQQEALTAANQRHLVLSGTVEELQQGLEQLEVESLAYQKFNDKRFWASSVALTLCFFLLVAGCFY